MREGDWTVVVDFTEGTAVPDELLGICFGIEDDCCHSPVVRYAFIAWGPCESAVSSLRDGEEGFECFFIKDAVGIFGRVVGHQSR